MIGQISHWGKLGPVAEHALGPAWAMICISSCTSRVLAFDSFIGEAYDVEITDYH